MSRTPAAGPTRFGVSQAPFHKLGISPTVHFERDLELIERADQLGFQEAWVGEHHSGGHEPIGSPELFLAAASQRTRTIRLGTGVTSLPYHNPFMVAELHVLLDHLSHGRAMMGFGPGQLASDAHMPARRTSAGTAVQHPHYRGRRRLGRLTGRTDGCRPVRAGNAQPRGHRSGRLRGAARPLADRRGGGAQAGTSVSRENWRLAGIMHLAETDEQARRDCGYGFEEIWGYLGEISPLPPSTATTLEGKIDEAVEAGLVCIGTPDKAAELIERLAEQSGGFGCFVMNLTDFAPPAARLRSLELFAEYVIPHFRGQLAPMWDSHDWVLGEKGSGETTIWKEQTVDAIAHATKSYEAERTPTLG